MPALGPFVSLPFASHTETGVSIDTEASDGLRATLRSRAQSPPHFERYLSAGILAPRDNHYHAVITYFSIPCDD